MATCVYGSYDCPEVWALRRFRDDTLEKSFLGRSFITLYYSISPSLVKLFGNNDSIKRHWRKILDTFVKHLVHKGVQNTPYQD